MTQRVIALSDLINSAGLKCFKACKCVLDEKRMAVIVFARGGPLHVEHPIVPRRRWLRHTMSHVHDQKSPTPIQKSLRRRKKAAPKKAVPAVAVLIGSLRQSPAQSQTLTAGEVAKAGTKPSQVAESTSENSHTARARIDPTVSTLVQGAAA